jgi:hypothetical protein
MRRNLFKYVDEQIWLESTIQKFSFKPDKNNKAGSSYLKKQLYPTVLLTNIIINETDKIDHLWFQVPIQEHIIMKIETGLRVLVKAKVHTYLRKKKKIGVGIGPPSKIQVMGKDPDFKGKQEDFIFWWLDQRRTKNIVDMAFQYDELVLYCRWRKYKNNSINLLSNVSTR